MHVEIECGPESPGLIAGTWALRVPLSRIAPIDYTGEVMRIAKFNKGGINRDREGTHQLNQFALIFEDGFQCEGSDTSFAAIREGDVIEIRGYHDVKGVPIFDPEWWECDEAQLVRIAVSGDEDQRPDKPLTNPFALRLSCHERPVLVYEMRGPIRGVVCVVGFSWSGWVRSELRASLGSSWVSRCWLPKNRSL